MAKHERPKRIELLPDADPEMVQAALRLAPEPEPVIEVDPNDPDAVWLLGDDPESNVSRTADRRGLVQKRVKSEGAQFVYGLVVLAVSLGAVALAATIRTVPFYIAAGVIFPVGVIWFRSRWRRWLGAAPYCYKLLTSLGEDAENVLHDHERRKREKYVKAIGDLYEHTRPKE